MSHRRQQVQPQEKIEDNTPQENVEKPTSGGFVYISLCIALGLQLLTLIIWPIALYFRDSVHFSAIYGQYTPRDETTFLFIIPLSGLLISLGYWENFTTEDKSIKYLRTLGKIKKLPIVSKYAVYLYVSVWKCLIYFVMLLLIQAFAAYYHERNLNASWDLIKQLFTDFVEAFTSH